jgi:S-adenosylmethionine hydrolase
MGDPLPISFLSDYGYEDDFVGVCHGVIQRIAPGARVIDVAHGLPRHQVRPAAIALRNTLRFMPEGVHLAVVDPGVGSERRPVALRARDGRLLVGPDNGLLAPAFDRCGGVQAAVDLTASPYRLEPVSATFHGRDVFAPVAARLSLGTPLEELGVYLPESELTRLELPAARVADGLVSANVVHVDRFGNAQLNLGRDELSAAGFEAGEPIVIESKRGRYPGLYARTFSDVVKGGLLAYEDSYGAVALALNLGHAAAALGIVADEPVSIMRE